MTIHSEKDAPFLSTVERGLDPAEAVTILTSVGGIAEQQLFALEKRYNNVKIDKYVVMPTHIHAIIRLTEQAAGASCTV